MRPFEVARRAPSTCNEQEWRLAYARRDIPKFFTFFDVFMEVNRAWCGRAAGLMVVLSHGVSAREGRPNPVHTFGAGATFENPSLRRTAMGLVVRGRAGFDLGRGRASTGILDHYDVEAMVAVGHPGDPDGLPPLLREREVPSGREPVGEVSRAGPFAS